MKKFISILVAAAFAVSAGSAFAAAHAGAADKKDEMKKDAKPAAKKDEMKKDAKKEEMKK